MNDRLAVEIEDAFAKNWCIPFRYVYYMEYSDTIGIGTSSYYLMHQAKYLYIPFYWRGRKVVP